MKNSAYTKGSIKSKINNQFKNPPVKAKRKYTKKKKDQSLPMKKKLLLLAIFITILAVIPKFFAISSDYLESPKSPNIPCIWEICSIDTMKTSRDKARDNLNNPAYDEDIKQQLKLIKETGANYVAIDTPYDEEFRPYLERWVKYAREADLKVWFRGNWSNWEGWFGYEKNMSPDMHLQKTAQFIETNPDLFVSGDIFDPCPECENVGFWPQPYTDKEYQDFIKKQQENSETSFRKIKKWVTVHQSIIGGRAKDVVKDQSSYDTMGKVVAIDHYVKTPQVMSSFIEHFCDTHQTKTLVSEFGAPIPDLNGSMTDKQQAEFTEQILKVLYERRDTVIGLNYWVLSLGTTSIIDDQGNPKPAYEVLKKYFSPGMIRGTIKNPLDENLTGIVVKTTDGISQTKTDARGNYELTLPAGDYEIQIENPDYNHQSGKFLIEQENIKVANFTLEPKNSGLIYDLKLWWKNTF